MERELAGKICVQRRFEVEHGAVGPHGKAREHARRQIPVKVGRDASQAAVAFEVFGEPQDAPVSISCRRRRHGQAATVKIKPFGEAVGVEHRLVAGLHDACDDPLQHARPELGTGERDMVRRPFDERARRSDQRAFDAEPRGHGERVAVTAARGEDDADAGPANAVNRIARGLRDLVTAVGDRAIDVQHEESRLRGRDWQR